MTCNFCYQQLQHLKGFRVCDRKPAEICRRGLRVEGSSASRPKDAIALD